MGWENGMFTSLPPRERVCTEPHIEAEVKSNLEMSMNSCLNIFPTKIYFVRF